MQLKHPISRAINGIISFFRRMLAPQFCVSCRTFTEKRDMSPVSFLCGTCRALIKPIVSTSLPIRSGAAGQRQPIRVFALSDYQNPLKKLIRAKNHGNFLAARQLGILMGHLLSPACLECDCLVPVPIHATRRMRRGFNQSKIIADTLGKLLNKPVIDCLKKIKRTPFQAQLGARARRENTRDIFACKKNAAFLHNKHVIIIDDLMTTGATLTAASTQLQAFRPASLKACVACRTL